MMPLTQLTTRTATRAARLNARRYPRKHHAPAQGVPDVTRYTYTAEERRYQRGQIAPYVVVADDGRVIQGFSTMIQAQAVAAELNDAPAHMYGEYCECPDCTGESA